MSRILEQDDLGGGLGDPMMDDPMMSDPMMDDPTLDTATTASPEQQETQVEPGSIEASLPSAFNQQIDDEEIVKIKLDSLEAQFEPQDGPFGGDSTLDPDEISIDLDFDDEDDDEGRSDYYDSEDEISLDVVSESTEEEILEEEELELDEVLEALRFEGEPQKSGWAGTPEAVMREYESALIARENDTELEKDNKALRDRVAELQEQKKIIDSVTYKLQKQNEEYNKILETLQERLESANVSNAKLLYINQTLENASLNERQKRRIVEAISKADSVKQAKMVYETLQDTVGVSGKEKIASSLNEAVTRRSSLLIAARQHKNKNEDANPLFDRMQKLAGIKTH